MPKLNLKAMIAEGLKEYFQKHPLAQPIKEQKMNPNTNKISKSELRSLVREVVRQCIKEAGPQYKVRDGRSYVEQPGEVNRAREIQEDPAINENGPQYKVRTGKTQVEQPGKVNRAREIQEDPEVNENHKVQARSAKTINDVPQDPNNVRDPEVPNE